MITSREQIHNEYREQMETSDKQLKRIEQLLKNHESQSRTYRQWKHIRDLEKVNELLAVVEAALS